MCIALNFRVLILIGIYPAIQLDGLCHFLDLSGRLLKIIFEETLCRLQMEIISLIYLLVNRL